MISGVEIAVVVLASGLFLNKRDVVTLKGFLRVSRAAYCDYKSRIMGVFDPVKTVIYDLDDVSDKDDKSEL